MSSGEVDIEDELKPGHCVEPEREMQLCAMEVVENEARNARSVNGFIFVNSIPVASLGAHSHPAHHQPLFNGDRFRSPQRMAASSRLSPSVTMGKFEVRLACRILGS